MPAIAVINGILQTTMPLDDRGLAYGDGVFETVRIAGGQPILWELHLARLRRGCERLRIQVPDHLELQIREAWNYLLTASPSLTDQAVLKIILTRGSGGRGYRSASMAANLVVALQPLPEGIAAQQQGLKVRMLQQCLADAPALAGIKHLNRLEQVLASLELEGEDEGLVCDQSGAVIEGTKSNLLVLHESGVWLTPDLSRCGIAGVLREYLLQHAERLGIRCEITQVYPAQLQSAQALALMNSVMGLCPIRSLNGVEWPKSLAFRNLQIALHSELQL